MTVNVVAATSAGVTVQVTSPASAPTPATVSVVTSANPVVSGNSVKFTATVTGTTPTGSVAFRADGSTITGCAASTLVGTGQHADGIVHHVVTDARRTQHRRGVQRGCAQPVLVERAVDANDECTVARRRLELHQPDRADRDDRGRYLQCIGDSPQHGHDDMVEYDGAGTVGAYSLGAVAPYDTGRWNVAGSPHRVPVVGSVAPGATTTFVFNVVAPSVAGTYDFQWQMVEEGVTWFGALTPRVPITVSAAAASLDATFVSQSVPATMTAGSRYNVSVSMRNSGTVASTSTPGTFSLGSQQPRDNNIWAVSPVPGRVPVSGSTAPGATATFSFNVGAPSTPGLYNFQWQMVDEGVAWFGQATANVQVNVLPPPGSLNASFVAQSVPSVMTAGATYAVTVSMRNTGTVTWTNPTGAGGIGAFSLGSQSPQDTSRWRVSAAAPHRVAVPAPVPPGATTTMSFNVVAPSTPGTYDFQWQMVDDGVAWFGAVTPKLAISVVP